MIIILAVRTFALKTYPNFVTIDQFLRVLYSPKKYSDSRKNFNLSHNNIFNNVITKKKKSFQEQQQQPKKK